MEMDCDQLLYHLQLECPRVGRPVFEKNLAEILSPIFGKETPRHFAYLPSNSKAPVYRLPTKIILDIAKTATPCSRACLALSCKKILCVLLQLASECC